MYYTGVPPHTAADGISADAHDRAHKGIPHYYMEGEIKLTVILMHKQNFSVIQFTGVTNLAFNSGTNEVTITGSPTGTYSLNTYNIQIIW